MKIKSRLLAMLLAVLMIVGCIPLMISADSGEVVGADIPKITIESATMSIEELKAALGDTADNDIIFASDLESFTEGQVNTSFSADGSTAVNGASRLNFCAKDAASVAQKGLSIKADGDNKYISATKGENLATDYYFDVMAIEASGSAAVNAAKGKDKVGANFVYAMDIKGVPAIGGTLLTLTTRACTDVRDVEKKSHQIAKGMLSINENGELLVGSAKVGAVGNDKFVTVAMLVQPGTSAADSKYWVYVDGYCSNPEGFTFLTDSNITSWELTDANGDGVKDRTDYVPNHVRVYQVSQTKYADATELCYDNIQFYYSDTYFGAREGKGPTGFVEEDGKVYYYADGVIAPNADLGGFKTDAAGAVYRAVRHGKLVDFEALYTAKGDTGDNKNSQVQGGKALRPDYDSVPGQTLWVAPLVYGKNIQLNIADEYKTTLGDHDGVEFVFYGNNTEKSAALFAIYSGMQHTSGAAYISRYFDMVAEETVAYGTVGKEWKPITWGTYAQRVVDVEDKWFTHTLDINNLGSTHWGKGRDYFDFAHEAGLTSLQIILGGWDLGAAYEGETEANKGNLVINRGEGSLVFAGVYVVDNVYATSVNDIKAGYKSVGGVNVPLYGTGLKTYGENKFYYEPTTGELVKNKTFVEPTSKVCYTADANGICTLVTGVAKFDGVEHHYNAGLPVTGVYKINSVNYQMQPDGSVLRVSAGYTYPAAYSVAAHGNVAGETYGLAATFDNATLSNVGFISQQGISGLEKGGITIVNKCTGFELVDDGRGGKALKMVNLTSGVDPFLQYTSTVKTGQVVIEYDLMIGEDWDIGMNTMFRDETGNGNNKPEKNVEEWPFKINAEGYATTGKGTILAQISTTEYTRFSMACDFTAHTIDYYVNGVKVVDDVAINANLVEFDFFRVFQYNSDVGHQGTLYIDNFYTYSATEPVGVTAPALTTGVETYADGSIRFYTNGLPDTDTGIIEYSGKLYNKMAYGVAYLADGQVGGKWYFGGVIANGSYGEKWYDNGVLRDGFVDGVLYKDGKVFSGEYEGIRYEAGIVFSGLYGAIGDYENNKYYVDGKLSDGYVIVDETKMAYLYGADGKFTVKYSIEYCNVTLILQVDGVEEGREMIAFTAGNTLTLTLAERAGYRLEIDGIPNLTFNKQINGSCEIIFNYVTIQ